MSAKDGMTWTCHVCELSGIGGAKGYSLHAMQIHFWRLGRVTGYDRRPGVTVTQEKDQENREK